MNISQGRLLRRGLAVGHAILIDRRHVITCAHLVTPHADNLRLTLGDGARPPEFRVVVTARVGGEDAGADLAVLELDDDAPTWAAPPEFWPAAPEMTVYLAPDNDPGFEPIRGTVLKRPAFADDERMAVRPTRRVHDGMLLDGSGVAWNAGAGAVWTRPDPEIVVGMTVGRRNQELLMLPMQEVARHCALVVMRAPLPGPHMSVEEMIRSVVDALIDIPALSTTPGQRMFLAHTGIHPDELVMTNPRAGLYQVVQLAVRRRALDGLVDAVRSVEKSPAMLRPLYSAVVAVEGAVGSEPVSYRSPWDQIGPDRNEGPEPRAGSTPPVQRYLVGEMPTAVRVGTVFSLTVRVAANDPGPATHAAPLSPLPLGPNGVDVTIAIQPGPGLSSPTDLQQTLTVPVAGDSRPARFELHATAVGLQRVHISAWIGGTFLAELRLDLSVDVAITDSTSQVRAAPTGTVRARPGEVTLQVQLTDGRYRFQLWCEDYLFEPVLARSLTAAPGAAVERTVEMLRRMAADSSGYSTPNAARWLRETGVGLWQDMVPDPIKDQFWQLRDSITAFSIACPDDTMPWELLYPLSAGQDSGFLVEQFPVLRRVYAQGRARRIALSDVHWVVPPNSPVNAQDEITALRRVVATEADPGTIIASLDDLLALLDGGDVGLLHFACHNTFSVQNGSSIAMAGGPFVPSLLNSSVVAQRLARRQPLVFLNACRSAGVIPEYTHMIGWAGQFMAAGAGAFVGTMWPVRSTRASQYAEAFYSSLAAGEQLGVASMLARRAVRDMSDPTWLAYTTYGDPAAKAIPK